MGQSYRAAACRARQHLTEHGRRWPAAQVWEWPWAVEQGPGVGVGMQFGGSTGQQELGAEEVIRALPPQLSCPGGGQWHWTVASGRGGA